MDPDAEILDSCFLGRQNDGVVVVRVGPSWLGVHPHEVEVLPDHLQQAVQVPLLMCTAARAGSKESWQ